jgi:hypothetical protein
MKNLFKAGLMVALAVISTAASSQAAVLSSLRFAGTTTAGSSAPLASKAWSLSLTYVPNPTGAAAAISAATLTIGTETFLLNSGFGTPQITVISATGANNDQLGILAYFSNSSPGGVGNGGFAPLTLTVAGTSDVAAALASNANIQQLGAQGYTPVSGSFAFGTGLTAILNGAVPAPEPGSIALLSGLGLIVGRRMLKRRAAKQNVAV